MRVLVTRPAAEAARTCAALTAAGHEPIRAPVMEIRPVEGAQAAVARALDEGLPDALLVTSANGLHVLPPDLRARLTRIPAFAVGEGTAAAARELGVERVIAAAGDAASLSERVAAAAPSGARLLYLTARDRRDTLEATLSPAFSLITIAVYAGEAVTRLPAGVPALIGAGEIDAALHYSARSARLFAALCAAERVDPTRIGRHVGLSVAVCAVLASVMPDAGPDAIRVAAAPADAAMIAALA